jgi:hypothetical protein
MVYQIIVKRLGQIVYIFDGIESSGSLEAIERIESQNYPGMVKVVLTNRQGKKIEYEWSTYEFEARQLGMALS